LKGNIGKESIEENAVKKAIASDAKGTVYTIVATVCL
jgi:hypothetical protein